MIPLDTLRGVIPADCPALEPLNACARLWRARTGVGVVWQAAADDGTADLLVVDHADLGRLLRTHRLLPLNGPERTVDLVRLAGQSIGASFVSYRLGGDQWALPLVASSVVQAWRPDRLAGPVADWDDLLSLAQHRRVLLALRPPHSLLVYQTLCANLGQPCGVLGEAELNDPAFGASVLDRLRALVALLDPACFELDAPAVHERLARGDAAEHCAPYVEGHARAAASLAFANIPAAGEQGPAGAALCGAGVAVGAGTARPEAALAFAYWLASGDVQRGPFADAGGQPASSAAWNDTTVDAAAGGFYRATRETLEGAMIRPRHAGSVAFQLAAAERMNVGLRDGEPAPAIMADLNRLFAASFG